MSTAGFPERLGRYRITRVLGKGAMGLVYAAHDPVLDRQVAIKTILHPALQETGPVPDASSRFVREAQAIARLTHPHVVTVFDFGEEDGIAYIVMELLQGRELKRCFDAGESFEPATAVRIMAELLDALEYAHRNGVVHRDVKPANVMLDAAGRVKLADFGVARLADAGGDRTVAGTMVGTPNYMSPEQVQGLPVGSRADIFAAGILLYQFLTRRLPFPGPGPWAVQKQIVGDDPPPPSLVNPALGPYFDAVVARALAKNPAGRFGTAAEFAAELKRALLAHGGADRTQAAIPPLPPRQVAAAAGDATLADATIPARPADRPGLAAAAMAAGRWSIPARMAVILLAIAAALAAMAFLAFDRRAPAPAALTNTPTPASAPVVGAEPPAAGDAAKTPAGVPAEPSVPAPTAAPAPARAAAPSPAPTAPLRAAAAAGADEPSTKTRTPVRQGSAGKRARCEDLLQRFQLGEPLSTGDLTTLHEECNR
jgi:hypothetical protein